MICLSSLPYGAFAEVTPCDRLATHPADPDRNTAGIERGEMDLQAAIAACREAVRSDPLRARSHYHLGRALYYSGQLKESIQHLEIAAEAGYRQAIFVLGYVLSEEGLPRNDCRAGELFLRGVGLEHPWSGVYFAEDAIDGRFKSCSFDYSVNQVERALHVAEEQITVGASKGRVEALRARLNKATLR